MQDRKYCDALVVLQVLNTLQDLQGMPVGYATLYRKVSRVILAPKEIRLMWAKPEESWYASPPMPRGYGVYNTRSRGVLHFRIS